MSLSLPGVSDQIRDFHDPVLKSACSAVEDFGESTIHLANALLARLESEPNGAGLAANQIGIRQRAFAYDLRYRGDDFHGVIFNPTISDGDGLAVYQEGCLSIPDFFWPVERPEQIVLTGQDRHGDNVEFQLDGIASRLAQHESDHLDGLLIFDRISDRSEKSEALAYAEDLLINPPDELPKRRFRSIFS